MMVILEKKIQLLECGVLVHESLPDLPVQGNIRDIKRRVKRLWKWLSPLGHRQHLVAFSVCHGAQC